MTTQVYSALKRKMLADILSVSFGMFIFVLIIAEYYPSMYSLFLTILALLSGAYFIKKWITNLNTKIVVTNDSLTIYNREKIELFIMFDSEVCQLKSSGDLLHYYSSYIEYYNLENDKKQSYSTSFLGSKQSNKLKSQLDKIFNQ